MTEPQPAGPSYHVERMPLSKLITMGNPDNPKDHDTENIARSIRRFGFVQMPTLDERTQTLVAGHGRVAALHLLRTQLEEGDPPPANITVDKDEWLVPVLRGIAFANKTERDAYLIADNQHTISGGWNDAKLRTVLRRMRDDRPSSIGFGENELKRLLDRTKERGKAARERLSAGLAFKLVVTCEGEADQATLMDRLEAEGYKCSPLIS